MLNQESSMITIRSATPEDYRAIQEVAHQTWPVTFGGILSAPQIAYMLDRMYSLSALWEQVEERNHVFLLAEEEGSCLGYLSYELSYAGTAKTKIHKIYVLPATQGKGVGKHLLSQAEQIARDNGNNVLTLNVNRYNKAVQFYQKLGFAIIGSEDIDIGNGFLMEDYILEKTLL